MRIGFVTTLQPETHYSRWLLDELIKKLPPQDSLFVYSEKDSRNKKLSYPNLRLAFSQDKTFPQTIINALVKDKIELVHLQHEINMFGGAKTAYLFPKMLREIKKQGIKTIVTFHGVVSPSQIDTEFLRTFTLPPLPLLVPLVKLFFRYLFRSSRKYIDLAITHSEFTRQILIKDYGWREKQGEVVRLGVPNRKLKIENLKLKIKKPFALYFGYILKRKGLEYLLGAWEKVIEKHPDWQLVLAGGTLDYQKKYADALKIKVANSALKNKVIFTGFLKEDQLYWLYNNCQFVVLPYTLSISSSLPLSFAILYQKPVIATNIGTLKEEVENGKSGLLVLPENAPSLEKAIKSLIENRSLYQRLKKNLIQVQKERSWKRVAGKTLGLYNKLS